jgi:hypothetical protein
VISYNLINERVNPDEERYRNTILDAAETVLSTLGFSREIYGLKKADKWWWPELLDER